MGSTKLSTKTLSNAASQIHRTVWEIEPTTNGKFVIKIGAIFVSRIETMPGDWKICKGSTAEWDTKSIGGFAYSVVTDGGRCILALTSENEDDIILKCSEAEYGQIWFFETTDVSEFDFEKRRSETPIATSQSSGAASTVNPPISSPNTGLSTANNQGTISQGATTTLNGQVYTSFATPSWWSTSGVSSRQCYTGVWTGWWGSGASARYPWIITLDGGTKFNGRSSWCNSTIVQVAVNSYSLQFIEDSGTSKWTCIGQISGDGKTITGYWGSTAPSDSLPFEIRNPGYPNALITL